MTLGTLSYAIAQVGLMSGASGYEIALKVDDPWTNGRGIALAEEVLSGFTCEVSSAEQIGSLNSIRLRGVQSAGTQSDPPVLSKESLKFLDKKLRAQERSGTVTPNEAVKNLAEIRRLTGLNWEKIAELLNVDRRSVYNWLQGGTVRSSNQLRIAGALALIRFIDEGEQAANLTKLTERSGSNPTLFELVAANQHADALEMAKAGSGRASDTWGSQDQSFVREFALDISPPGFELDDEMGPELSDEPAEPTRKRKLRRI